MSTRALLVAGLFVVGCGGGTSKDATPASKPTVAQEQKAETKAAETKAGEDATVRVVRPEDEAKEPAKMPVGHGEPPSPSLDDLTVASPGHAYGQVLIQTRSESVHLAELTVVRAERKKAQTGTVTYTAEPRVIVGTPAVTLEESDLLGSGIALDIDGDGKTSSSIKTRCDAGTAVLATTPPRRLEPVLELTDDVARFIYGEAGSRVLSAPSAGAVMYAPCDKGLIVGLDPTAPLRFFETPSPSVFIVYRAKVDSFDAEDPFTLQALNAGEDELPHELYSFREVNTKDGEAQIFAAHLVVAAIDPAAALQQLSLKIAGEKPEFVTASINEVDADGNRIRYADGFKPF
ncbi:MAG: hypothetical protein AAGA54_00880 [Myxococcota bacterium]